MIVANLRPGKRRPGYQARKSQPNRTASVHQSGNLRRWRTARTGAVLPLFAFLLPILLIFSGFAINLAYMQMVSTDIKIASDAAAHAGGRAMSIKQTTNDAIAEAIKIAEMNTIGGRNLSIAEHGDQLDIGFGLSQRSNGGYGMYQFSSIPKSEVDARTKRANSVSVNMNANMPLAFQAMNLSAFGGNTTHFDMGRRSIATQVDRDIALVLDRSGSMLFYMDETGLDIVINALYNSYETVDNGWWTYRTQRQQGTGKNKKWVDNGYRTQQEINDNSAWQVNYNDKKWVPNLVSQRKISQSERSNALKGNAPGFSNFYTRSFTNNVVYQVEKHLNEEHSLGDSYTQAKQPLLQTPMAQYISDWLHFYQGGKKQKAMMHSRWYYLVQGVDAFLDVLEGNTEKDIKGTDQIEYVSLTTFATNTRVDLQIQTTDYQPIRDAVKQIVPYDGTATGSGMIASVPSITTAPLARPFAAKTMIVLTDGQANTGIGPAAAAQQIRSANNIVIHTVTFTQEAEIGQMLQAAQNGSGKHYHTDDGADLVSIFEEIANNLPTILTE